MSKMPDEMSLKARWVHMQCRGMTVERIAQETNSDKVWVRSFLTRNNLKALERMAKERAAERAKQVMRLEHMINEAYDAWERSTGPEEVTEDYEEPIGGSVQVNQSPGPAGGYNQVYPSSMSLVKTKKTIRTKTGEIAYLKAMADFMRDIRSILKIDDGTKRIDFSLSVPDDSGIKVALNTKDIAAAQLHEWNMQQKERLQQLLEMPPPEILDGPDRPLTSNGDGADSDHDE